MGTISSIVPLINAQLNFCPVMQPAVADLFAINNRGPCRANVPIFTFKQIDVDAGHDFIFCAREESVILCNAAVI